MKEKEQELEEWKNQKDPEPEQSDAVRKNRELLKEKGIPFLQFYKVIDFSSELGEKQMDHLEEALLAMGGFGRSYYSKRIQRTGTCSR